MPSKEILEQVLSAVTELKPDWNPPAADDALKLNMLEDLKLDSLDVINLLFTLEEEFDVKIPEPDIDAHNLYVIGNLVRYISDASASGNA